MSFCVMTPFAWPQIQHWWDDLSGRQKYEKTIRLGQINICKQYGGALEDYMKLRVLSWNLYNLGSVSTFMILNNVNQLVKRYRKTYY